MNDIKYHEPYSVIDQDADSQGRAGIFTQVSLTPSQALSNTALQLYVKRGVSYHPL